jgi:hypothetical protein
MNRCACRHQSPRGLNQKLLFIKYIMYGRKKPSKNKYGEVVES